MKNNRRMRVDLFTRVSVYLEMFIKGGEKPIGKGTGFIIRRGNKPYLVTCWHCLTGRNPETSEPISKSRKSHSNPDFIRAHFFNYKENNWQVFDYPLKENGKKRWFEHPKGNYVDVGILPISIYDTVEFASLNLDLMNTKLNVYPSKAVSIIGFPKGLTSSGMLPIWKKGHIASDLQLDYYDKPIFLIDANNREGMSGSPVILKESGMCEFENGAIAQGTYVRFLGVYAGRVKGDESIGRVFKAKVINEIIEYNSL